MRKTYIVKFKKTRQVHNDEHSVLLLCNKQDRIRKCICVRSQLQTGTPEDASKSGVLGGQGRCWETVSARADQRLMASVGNYLFKDVCAETALKDTARVPLQSRKQVCSPVTLR